MIPAEQLFEDAARLFRGLEVQVLDAWPSALANAAANYEHPLADPPVAVLQDARSDYVIAMGGSGHAAGILRAVLSGDGAALLSELELHALALALAPQGERERTYFLSGFRPYAGLGARRRDHLRSVARWSLAFHEIIASVTAMHIHDARQKGWIPRSREMIRVFSRPVPLVSGATRR